MKRFLNRILFNTNKLSRTVFHHYPSFLTPTHAQRIFDWFCEYLLWSPRSFPWNLINQQLNKCHNGFLTKGLNVGDQSKSKILILKRPWLSVSSRNSFIHFSLSIWHSDAIEPSRRSCWNFENQRAKELQSVVWPVRLASFEVFLLCKFLKTIRSRNSFIYSPH